MLMSELIEHHQSDRVAGGYLKTLARALMKTGPVMHEGYTWTGRLRYGRHSVEKALKFRKGVRDSAGVEVPWGMLPELAEGGEDRPIDSILIERLKGYVAALESGGATSENPEDMEALVGNLEDLADEIRQWGMSRVLRRQVELMKDRFAARRV